jgi:oxygen-independent coproporphyrinogen-3 oxidase
MALIDINKLNNLMKKYNNLYAMYIEYPHKSFWSGDFNDGDFRTALKSLFSSREDPPLLLYLHIPFCPKQCYYCTCHTFIAKDYEKIKKYLNYLFYEIDMLRNFFDKHAITPNFREIHLGGGSPTILQEKEFDQLLEKLQSIADINKLSEFAIEIDPRVVTRDTLKYYRAKGINRISFGVQDFDPDVQKAVNRIQPRELIEDLLTPDIRECFKGINFDIMWGLPRQTRETFRRTIDTVLELSPDRISLLLLHYAPDVKKHQKLMKKSELPNAHERTMLFHEAVQTLLNNDYVRIGLEHFAKPTDDLAKAMKNKTLQWNSLGYTTGRYFDVIGIGPGSSSTINDYYFQNVYPLSDYELAVSNGRFPILRGYKLNGDDVIRRDIIHKLRCYFFVDCLEIEYKFDIKFEEYFENEKLLLEEFAKDGLLEVSEKTFRITELGKYFTFQICHTFDNFAEKKLTKN